MKIKILRTTVADQRIVRAGSVEDVSERDAMTLIQLGKAVAHEAAEAFEYEPPLTASQTGLTSENTSAVVAEKRRGRPRKGN